jgi:hypothetical protein
MGSDTPGFSFCLVALIHHSHTATTAPFRQHDAADAHHRHARIKASHILRSSSYQPPHVNRASLKGAQAPRQRELQTSSKPLSPAADLQDHWERLTTKQLDQQRSSTRPGPTKTTFAVHEKTRRRDDETTNRSRISGSQRRAKFRAGSWFNAGCTPGRRFQNAQTGASSRDCASTSTSGTPTNYGPLNSTSCSSSSHARTFAHCEEWFSNSSQ